MKTKDYLIVALAPLFVLLIPLVGVMTSPEWKWTLFDFAVAWVVLALTTFVFRVLVTRNPANLAYRAGVGLAVARSSAMTIPATCSISS
jgi:1-acyl-sn-glycerol-3-phosphate acyltransferase